MQIKRADLVKMGDAQPIKDTEILLMLGGSFPPRFARYTKSGYSVQGIIGITPIHETDLWADISDLLKS